MKLSHKFYFALFFSLIISCSAFGIDKETLWSKLNFPGSLNQFIETKRIAKQNINLVEEILFFSDMQRYNGPARENSLQILKECSEDGQISKEHFFDLSLRLYNQIGTIANPRKISESKNDINAALANFGCNIHYSISQQFTGFSALMNSMSTAGLIKNNGIINSLNQKIDNAKKSLDKKNNNAKKTAINQIEAAINELNALRGNQVTEDGHKILTQYCQNLITKIQKTN